MLGKKKGEDQQNKRNKIRESGRKGNLKNEKIETVTPLLAVRRGRIDHEKRLRVLVFKSKERTKQNQE